MAPRKTASSKAAGKRRQVQSDNSDVKVLNMVPISPRKKKVTSKAVPTSEQTTYNMLAESDFSYVGLLLVFKSPVFSGLLPHFSILKLEQF
ncbi:hypothetical protein BD779DRAFT_1685221 [Infundibulicybe gibba]|nr:hypothetical protein BD779DRAFT_1685221 [Infundibulicybe gibba]